MDLRRQEATRVHLSSGFPLQVRSSKLPLSGAWSNTVQRGAGSVELRHPSSIETTLNSPKTFQQLGSLFCARLRDNSRLLDHLQSWLSYWSSTSSTLATLVSWSHGKVLFIQNYAVGEIFLMSNFFLTRWLPGFAFSLVLICYEELRKAISRLVNGHYCLMN